jgi:hypothetical protein
MNNISLRSSFWGGKRVISSFPFPICQGPEKSHFLQFSYSNFHPVRKTYDINKSHPCPFFTQFHCFSWKQHCIPGKGNYFSLFHFPNCDNKLMCLLIRGCFCPFLPVGLVWTPFYLSSAGTIKHIPKPTSWRQHVPWNVSII